MYIVKNVDIKVLYKKNITKKYNNKEFSTLLINNEFSLKQRDKIKFTCNKCKKQYIEYYKFNIKFHKDKILCKNCIKKKNNLIKYGVDNPAKLSKIKEKVKQTNLKRYGVESPMQSKEIQNKSKQTCLEKYGVEYILQNKEKMKQGNSVKYNNENYNNRNKAKKTNLQRYGAENASQSEEIKNKKKQTHFKNYGVEYQLQSEEIRNNLKNILLKKYGVEYPIQSEEIKNKIKQTMLNRYGVENPSQVPEFHNKAMINAQKSYKLKQINENLHYQSQLELNFINECLNNNIEVWDGPSIPYYLDGKKHIYYIDFETNRWIVEIKGKHKWYYRDLESGVLGAKNEAAEEYAGKIGKKFKFILY